MIARWKQAGRKQRLIILSSGAIALAIAGYFAATNAPPGFWPGENDVATVQPGAADGISAGSGEDSVTLAQLLARSPGVRVGGIALKAKKRRRTSAFAESAPARSAVPAGEKLPPVASVLSAGPVGEVVPGTPSAFPADFFPPLASAGGGAPGSSGAIPPTIFPPGPFPGGGGPLIVIPPGGGSPGGGGGIPGGGGNPDLPAPPPPVPEPATWLMMILGFGMVGSRLRHSTRRVAAV